MIGVLMDDTDPLVTVMKVEKAPQETYADIGGLDNQIQEIKVRSTTHTHTHPHTHTHTKHIHIIHLMSFMIGVFVLFKWIDAQCLVLIGCLS